MIKRFLPLLIIMATLFLGLITSTCGRFDEISPTELKGVSAAEMSPKEVGIDYQKIFEPYDPCDPSKINTVTFTALFAYANEESEKMGADLGTMAAYQFKNWIVLQNNGLFPAGLTVQKDTFPANLKEVVYGGFYYFSGLVKNLRVQYRYEDQIVTSIVDLQIEIYLGTSTLPDDRSHMSPDFRDALAKSLVSSDIVAYNGNVWTYQQNLPKSPKESLPADSSTKDLVEAIQKLGGRDKYGIIFFNMCWGEKIEQVIYSALRPASDSPDFVEISHRHYSDYSYFGQQLSHLLINVLHGQSLPKILLDLTPTASDDQWTDPTTFDDPKVSVDKFKQYQENEVVLNDDNAVLPVVKEPIK